MTIFRSIFIFCLTFTSGKIVLVEGFPSVDNRRYSSGYDGLASLW